jgi:hypothetical protein
MAGGCPRHFAPDCVCSLLMVGEKSFPLSALYCDSGKRYRFFNDSTRVSPRDPPRLCVMAPTQSSDSSFSWSTLKEARKRLFFLLPNLPALWILET